MHQTGALQQPESKAGSIPPPLASSSGPSGICRAHALPGWCPQSGQTQLCQTPAEVFFFFLAESFTKQPVN